MIFFHFSDFFLCLIFGIRSDGFLLLLVVPIERSFLFSVAINSSISRYNPFDNKRKPLLAHLPIKKFRDLFPILSPSTYSYYSAMYILFKSIFLLPAHPQPNSSNIPIIKRRNVFYKKLIANRINQILQQKALSK